MKARAAGPIVSMIRLAARELRHEAGRLAPAFLALAAGFFGAMIALGLQGSAQAFLNEKSREILTADIAMSSLRDFKPEEIQAARDELRPLKMAQEIAFNTVAQSASGRGMLVDVRAVDPVFPVYGRFRVRDLGGQEREEKMAGRLSSGPQFWATPDAQAELGLKPGDRLALGRTSFVFGGVAIEAPGASSFGGFAPRLFIGKRFAEGTGLMQLGSQVFHRVYFQLDPRALADAPERLRKAVPDPDIFLRTPDDAVQGFERFFQFLMTYLGAASIAVLALAWAAALYALQSFAQTRLRNAAIMGALGASNGRIGALYALELAIIAWSAFAAAALLAWATFAGVDAFGASLLPVGFTLRLQAADFGAGFGAACAAAVAFAAPTLVRLRSARPRDLLGDDAGLLGASDGRRRPWLAIAAYGPMLIALFALGSRMTGSPRQGAMIAAGLVGVALLGWAIGRAAFGAAFRAWRAKPGLARVALASLARGRPGTTLLFVALTASSLVLNVAPHLLATAEAELAPLQEGKLPDFFLFNIPDESLDKARAFVEGRGATFEHASPMILARWTAHAGAPPREAQMQKFPVRISYRAKPIPSETIVEGAWPIGPYREGAGALPEISVESGFAERNGVKMGDELEFDVQGVPVKGRVTSMRRVRWTDFHPNFFMEFQPGVIDDAPKTWLASIHLPAAGKAESGAFLRDLVAGFPELSAIDVGRALEKAAEAARNLAGPVQASAWAAAGIAFLILIAATVHGLRGRAQEFDVQKLVGADASLIRRLTALEHFALAFAAALVGAVGGLGISYGIVKRFFETSFVFDARAMIVSFALLVGAVTALAWLAADRALRSAGASSRF